MEFDKSRVYTSLNADELRAGDKVVVADTMQGLAYMVKANEGVIEIDHIEDMGEEKRFSVKAKHETVSTEWHLAYLVERNENCTNCGNLGNSYCSCFTRNKSDDELSRTVCGNYIKLSESKTKQKADKHTDYNHCEEAVKATNVCPNKHYRPFKDTNELVKEWNKKLGYTDPTGSKLTEPYIWVRSRFNKDHKGVLINNYFDEYVELGTVQCFLTRLFNEYIFLDGSPCGVEE